jgi:hypothetical protein
MTKQARNMIKWNRSDETRNMIKWTIGQERIFIA